MTSPQQTVPTKCLHCNSALESPIVCAGCQTLYPLPESVDYFTLFRMPRRYDLDIAQLERKFLSISRNIHPDFFGGESEEMQQLSVRLAAEMNEALRVLKDPVLRAGYLLEQAGGRSGAGDRSVPQSVLTEVMMMREELEEARGDADTLASIRDRADRRRSRTLDQIAEIADRLDTATDDRKAQLRQLLNSVKYYDNLLAELPLN